MNQSEEVSRRPWQEVKFCRKCGLERTRMKSGALGCQPCFKIYQKKWSEENAERVKAVSAEHYKRNKERIQAAAKARRAATPNQKEIDAERYRKNKTNRRKSSKKWQQKNVERCYSKALEWRANNPEKTKSFQLRYRRSDKGRAMMAAKNSNRRARIQNSPGRLTVKETAAILKAASSCCYCHKPFGRCRSTRATIDHVVALNNGGFHNAENTVVCCGGCNSRKKDRPLDVFFRLMERTKSAPVPSPSEEDRNTCP